MRRMPTHTADPTSRYYLDTSAWIAYIRGTIPELKAIVEGSEILTSEATLIEIAERCVDNDKYAGEILRSIESKSDPVSVGSHLIDWILNHGVGLDARGIAIACAATSDATLLVVEDDRLIRRVPKAGLRFECPRD